MFRFTHLYLERYRCFESLEIPLGKELTIMCSEPMGGKTSALTALAVGLAAFQAGTARGLAIDPRNDPLKVESAR